MPRLHTVRDIACLCILLYSFALTAHAYTSKTNLSVSAVVPSKVVLSTTPMNFGIVSTTKTTLAQATASITVNMVATQVYHITLDAGLHKLGSRRMSDGMGNFVGYNLYQNASHTTAWGDSGYGNTYTAGSALATTGTGADQVFTVYGQFQSLPSKAGNYSDTITVTVHY